MTPAQRDEAIETLERNLGLTGQPRFVVEHQKEGRTHWHVVWSRIDTEKMQAIPDSLTAVIHERTSRDLEIRFDLERGQSVLVANREHERPERRPQKNETLRAAETGVDLETVKADAQAARQRADNGQSFRAALEASGDYVLARGDTGKRDTTVTTTADGNENENDKTSATGRAAAATQRGPPTGRPITRLFRAWPGRSSFCISFEHRFDCDHQASWTRRS